MVDIHDYDIQCIENEIILTYEHSLLEHSQFECLLTMRKDMINKRVLAHQEEILPDIIAFNDALTATLHELYDRTRRIWGFIKYNKDFGENTEVFGKCLLPYTYPEEHPVQGEDREILWEALCSSGWNPLYADGISLPRLRFSHNDEEETFTSLIGMEYPPPNWNEGLDREQTKDLHLTSAFHNIFEHMNFAITDFIYVRKFETEISIETN